MMAWAPFAIMSLLLLLSGLVRQAGGEGPVSWARCANYMIPVPG